MEENREARIAMYARAPWQFDFLVQTLDPEDSNGEYVKNKRVKARLL